MSDKCEHNNHSHWFIWWALMFLAFDCSGSERSIKNDVSYLKSQVSSLQSEVARCKKQ